MINVMPVDDLIEHIEDTTCECGPTVQHENGSMIVVHHAADCRELYEQFGLPTGKWWAVYTDEIPVRSTQCR